MEPDLSASSMSDPNLFRATAIRHHLGRDQEGVPRALKVAPPWTWAVALGFLALFLLTFGASLVYRVEIQGSGRGVLRLASAAKPLAARQGGRVTRVLAMEGTAVEAGEPLLELQSPHPDLDLPRPILQAPEPGVLEGFQARVGDLVARGQVIARLVPPGAELRGYALLAERDRAFVRAGDFLRLELDAYPLADFGSLQGRIRRVAETPLGTREFRELFGEEARLEGSAYLVEVAIEPDQKKPVALKPLRSGMGFQARFVLRRQRLLTVLLDPLRAWLS